MLEQNGSLCCPALVFICIEVYVQDFKCEAHQVERINFQALDRLLKRDVDRGSRSSLVKCLFYIQTSLSNTNQRASENIHVPDCLNNHSWQKNAGNIDITSKQ